MSGLRARATNWADRFDRALLLIPLIGLVAVWPFLTQSLPSTDDGALHLFRLAEIDRCLRHGVLPLRWAPDFAHGYGYPFFNYYASLSSYIAELWHLVGLDYPGAIAAAIVTAFFASGWGAYLLARDVAGSKAGLVAATAYMYAPYQFYDSAYRGNLAEMWALALLPFVLWTGRRAVIRHRWRDIVPCALFYAALVWTHNVYALLGSPVLGLYVLLLWWRGGRSWRDAWRLGAMIAIGLALSAFFWLPAFFERHWTRFSTELVDYRTFFLSARELLSPPPQLDLALLNPYPPRSLSWGMLITIATGILLRVGSRIRVRSSPSSTRAGERRGEWAFFLALSAFASFMTVAPSDFLWRTVPLLNFALIPWRYLGIASLAGSLVAGMAVGALSDRPVPVSPALIGAGVAIVLLIATAIPWTYATPFPQPEDIGVAEIVGWEYSSRLIGTTAKNEYLPIWSSRLPSDPADPALLTDRDPIIARLDASSLPKDAELVSARYTLTRADLVIDTPRPFRARYKQLYFPGWRVTVDGQPVPQIATSPYGLLAFDVPAGRHRVVVRPVPTPLRAIGTTITLGAALALVSVVLGGRQGKGRAAEEDLGSSKESLRAAEGLSGPGRGGWKSGTHWAFIAILALVVLGVKEGIVDRTENLFRARRFDGTHVPGVQVATAVNFGDAFTLHGYDLPARPVVSGQPLRVDLYLSARQKIEGVYMAYARLVDESGGLWSLPDNGAPEGFRPPPPTTIWPTDAYGHWAYLAYTLPGTPPGTYWIEVSVFEYGTWRGLNVLDESGRITGLSARIGPVQVVRPSAPPDTATLGITLPLDLDVVGGLRLLGSALEDRSAQAGDAIDVTLFWQAVQPLAVDLWIDLSLVAGERTVSLGSGLPMGRAEHPTTCWEVAEVVRSTHRLRIPAAVDAGTYALEARVVDRQGDAIAAPVAIGELTVEPTERIFVLPSGVAHRLEVGLGDQVTLLGVDLPASEGQARAARGEALPVTLYWQAQREMTVSYKAFVQLVGRQGVLSQVDSVPVGWSRPTTGWVTGEVIVDRYALSIPADAPQGTYRLIAGLYDEGTLQRLALSGDTAGDHVVLAEVVVE